MVDDFGPCACVAYDSFGGCRPHLSIDQVSRSVCCCCVMYVWFVLAEVALKLVSGQVRAMLQRS